MMSNGTESLSLLFCVGISCGAGVAAGAAVWGVTAGPAAILGWAVATPLGRCIFQNTHSVIPQRTIF